MLFPKKEEALLFPKSHDATRAPADLPGSENGVPETAAKDAPEPGDSGAESGFASGYPKWHRDAEPLGRRCYPSVHPPAP